MGPLLDFGIRLITLLQGQGAWLDLPMKFISFLGSENFFMVVLPIVYWCINTSLGMQVAVILMLSNSANSFFKVALHGPRPYWISSAVKALATETSFGVPSGHTQNATVLWGVLAAFLRKGWAWLAAALLVVLTGLSRLYLGVHFPHDVVAGLLIGALLLWLVLRFWTPAVAWVKTRKVGDQVVLALAASLVLMLLPLIPLVWLRSIGWQPPQAWGTYASQALSMQDVFTLGGTTFGLLAGFAWINLQGGFQTRGNAGQLTLRVLVGVAGVLAILYGLKFLFPDGETVVAYLFRYVRYSLVGLWVAGGAPWCFLRLKLANKLEKGNITVSLLNDSGTTSSDI